MFALLVGFLGALLIGASDCIARVTTRRMSTAPLFFTSMTVSVIALTAAFAVWTLFQPPAWPSFPRSWSDEQLIYGWITSALSGCLTLGALMLLYKALARGPVAVASPAASTFTVMLIALNFLAGQTVDMWQVLSIAVVFLGVFMLARSGEPGEASDTAGQDSALAQRWSRDTAIWGLLSAVAISVRFFCSQESVDAIGSLESLYLNRFFALVSAVALLAYVLWRSADKQDTLGAKRDLIWPKGKYFWLLVGQSLLEVSAIGAMLIASADGGRTNAVIGFSAFSAVTALFAWIFLGEAIGRQRMVWLVLVVVGLMTATLFSG